MSDTKKKDLTSAIAVDANPSVTTLSELAEALKSSTESTLSDIVDSTIEKGIKEAAEISALKKKEKERQKKRDVALRPAKYEVLEDKFLVEKGILNILEFNIRNNISTLLVGPTGVGKTELVDCVARHMSKECVIFDMGTMADPVMSLIGTHTIVSDETTGKTISSFHQSRFSEKIQKPNTVILMDEINRAAPGTNNLLFPCLDFRRELPMEYSFTNSDPIKIHDDICFIATANIGTQYAGTHKIDKALEDRFTVIKISELNKEGMVAAIMMSFPKMELDVVTQIVEIYFDINKLHDEYKIDFRLSMRHLKTICKYIQGGITAYDSFYGIVSGLSKEEEMMSVVDAVLKSKIIVNG